MALQGISIPRAYCDSCPHARRVLSINMDRGWLPRAPILHDVQHVPDHLLNVDVVTAGFPCTGFSVCGSREAFKNQASALFFELVSVCKRAHPKLVIMENTPSIADSDSLRMVITSFERFAYKIEWCLMPAYAVGLPHNRLRWFAIAYPLGLPKSGLLKIWLRSKDKISQIPPEPSRTTSVIQTDHTVRFALLKNALIPACARKAVAYLLEPGHHHTQPHFHKLDVRLRFQQKGTCFNKTLWPTLFGNYRNGSKTLTDRCSRDLLTAIKFEVKTKPGHVNFAFLEWLMGFPTGWTSS